MTKKRRKRPLTVDQLRGAPWNPRKITREALDALRASLGRFGDLSGLVWNKRTGHLVAGHQRLQALREEYGPALRVKRGHLVSPDGRRWPIRVVDWDKTTAQMANIAANSPLLAGEFTPELDDLVGELAISEDILGALRLDELVGGLAPPRPERVSTKRAIDMVWVLFGVPATEWEKVSGAVRELEAAKGSIVETNIQ